jgi:cytoplasmic FMR1 interacting protein
LNLGFCLLSISAQLSNRTVANLGQNLSNLPRTHSRGGRKWRGAGTARRRRRRRKMTVPVEEAVAALSTFSLEHDQPDIQGLAVTLVSGRSTTESPVDFEDTPAYQLSLVEDTNAIIQLDTLIREGKGLVAVLYTYRSCVKALPQLPETVKQTQADLYLETYQVLDIEIGRLREMQRWQSSAAFKLAVDMHNYTQSIKRLNGPTVTHMW